MTDPGTHRRRGAHRAERRGPSGTLLTLLALGLVAVLLLLAAVFLIPRGDDAASEKPSDAASSAASGDANTAGGEPVVVARAKTSATTWSAVLQDSNVELGRPQEDAGTRELVSRALGEAENGRADKAATDEALKFRARTEGDAAPVRSADERLEQLVKHSTAATTASPSPLSPALAAGAASGAPPRSATVVSRAEWDAYRSRNADTELVASTPGDDAPTANDAALQQALAQWQHLAEPFHALVAIDASGSMGEKVDQDGSTRMDLTKAAAATAVGLFPEHDALGLWTFQRHLDGDKDYRSLTPVRELSASVDGGTQRDQLSRDAESLTYAPDGYTGLYDTTLAAYREVLHEDAPGHLRTVIVLTDGMNHDPGSISLDNLLTMLKDEQDPDNPVRIITVGISKDADEDVLKQIAEATGGSSHIARTPEDIQDVFVKALTSE
ncbi:VWA domain-containing protein [Kocuria marina subsp. indica]|uniref:VWA domain-containing protein n=1 Tax=Kocuria TaxID=57493 RepID=UPI00103BD729|nr:MULTISPECIES: VWA domain-containing protein [Kocuria]MDT0118847.1 VWA domain-containing protein [Kocuria sp. PD6]QBJ20516.1 VWA domain-containing protein [Kocuria indica]